MGNGRQLDFPRHGKAHVEIDVWLVDLSSPEHQGLSDFPLLSQDEQVRYARFKRHASAREFGITRSALRRILGAIVGERPDRLVLTYGPNGKPALLNFPECHFSVSHSGGMAAIGLHDSMEIGIDIESRRSFPEATSLQDIVCTRSELAWLDIARRGAVNGLAEIWTAKEALLKAVGSGFTISPRELNLVETLGRGQGAVEWPVSTPAVRGHALVWQMLSPRRDLVGALAAVVPRGSDRLLPRYRDLD